LHEIFISTAQHLDETPCKNLAQKRTRNVLKNSGPRAFCFTFFLYCFFLLWHLGSWQSWFKTLLWLIQSKFLHEIFTTYSQHVEFISHQKLAQNNHWIRCSNFFTESKSSAQ